MSRVRLLAAATGVLLVAAVLAATAHDTDERGTSVQAGGQPDDVPELPVDPIPDLSLPSTTITLPTLPPATATVPRLSEATRRTTTSTAPAAPKPTSAGCPGAAPAAGATGLWTVDAGTGALRHVVAEPVEHHRWSTDGSRIAYVTRDSRDHRGGALKVVDVASGQARTLHSGPVRGASWAPDGRIVAFALAWDGQKSGVASAPADGGDVRVVRESANPVADVEIGSRNRIAFTDGGRVLMMDADGGNERDAPQHPRTGVTDLLLSPDGTKVAFVDANLVVHDIHTGDQARFSSSEPPGAPVDWSSDGTRVSYRRVSGGFVSGGVARVDGAHFREVGAKGEGYTLSPSGDRLAWATGRGPDARVVVTDVASGAERTVATGLWQPTWSPTSEDIATLGMIAGTQKNFVCLVRGDTRRRVADLTGAPPYGTFEWSPSGTTLAFLTF